MNQLKINLMDHLNNEKDFRIKGLWNDEISTSTSWTGIYMVYCTIELGLMDTY